MELLTTKLLSMVGIAMLALFFGLLPLKVKKLILTGDENSKKRRRRENIISALLCFGAGVLIATVFLHMLPETREGFNKAMQMGILGGHDISVEADALTTDNDDLKIIHRRDKIPKNVKHSHSRDNKHDSHATGNSHDTGKDSDHDESDQTSRNHVDHKNHDHSDHSSRDHSDHSSHEPVDPAIIDHSDHTSHDHGDHISHDHGDHISHDHGDYIDHFNHDYQDDPHFQEYPIVDVLDPIVLPLGNAETMTLLNDLELNIENTTSVLSDAAENDNNEVLNDDNVIIATTPSPFALESEDAVTTDFPIDTSSINDEPAIFRDTIEVLPVVESPDLVKSLEVIKNDPHFEALTHDHNHENSNDKHSDDDHSGHDHGDEDHDQHMYPLAELTICIGFFTIYLIEEIVHKVFFGHSADSYEQSSSGSQNGHSHVHSHVQKVKNGGNHVDPRNGASPSPITSDAYPMEVNHTYSKGTSPQEGDWPPGIDNLAFTGDVDATAWNPRIKSSLLNNAKVLPMTDDAAIPNGDSPVEVSNGGVLPTKSIDDNILKKPTYSKSVLSTVQNLLIVLAIGFHAIFEGMAIGLQEEKEDVWYLTFAIAAHKFVIMFCVGLELLKDDTSKIQMVLSTIVLALITPIGTAIGIIVTENAEFGGKEHVLVVSILQGLAGGTLLYVAFLEILERERSKMGGRFLKFVSLIVGFGFMCSLEVIGGHSH